MEFLGESSGRFILSTSFRVCNTVEGETLPLRWDKYYKNIISCCKNSINGILWILLLVEDTALSISKTDAYFSITSARKVANLLLLRCKYLLGNTQTLELHPMDADLASPNEKVYGSNTLSAIGKQLFPVKKENGDD